MEVVIASLTVPDLEEVTRRGAPHSVLGPFLNGGSFCTVDGIAATPEGVAELLTAARTAASEAGLPLTEGAAPASVPATRDGITLLGDCSSDQDGANLGRIAGSAVLCLLVVDGATRSKPMAVLFGRGLPALGAIPSCTVRDLESTWISLAGGTTKGGRYLLHEQPEVWDPQIEQQLTLRLRQLYGE
jgi:hypothetical protein